MNKLQTLIYRGTMQKKISRWARLSLSPKLKFWTLSPIRENCSIDFLNYLTEFFKKYEQFWGVYWGTININLLNKQLKKLYWWLLNRPLKISNDQLIIIFNWAIKSTSNFLFFLTKQSTTNLYFSKLSHRI